MAGAGSLECSEIERSRRENIELGKVSGVAWLRVTHDHHHHRVVRVGVLRQHLARTRAAGQVEGLRGEGRGELPSCSPASH